MFAIGTAKEFKGGIPGPDDKTGEQEVELYAKCKSGTHAHGLLSEQSGNFPKRRSKCDVLMNFSV